MTPKQGSDRLDLETLAKVQAKAFQSISYFWNSAEEAAGNLYPKLSQALFMDDYRAASSELRALLEFPTFDESASPNSDLRAPAGSWRVRFVSHNAIFPPLWRVRALRTILPAELSSKLTRWRDWVAALRAGDHRSYLLDLFLHATTKTQREHWSQLVGLAHASFEKQTNWVRKPELVAVREEILHFLPPYVPDLALEAPNKCDSADSAKEERAIHLGEQVQELIRLTRAWDSRVKSGWKLRWYDRAYLGYDVESFVAASTDRLDEFFAWGEECARRGFGLFLDY